VTVRLALRAEMPRNDIDSVGLSKEAWKVAPASCATAV
jgi:hypothetical protein